MKQVAGVTTSSAEIPVRAKLVRGNLYLLLASLAWGTTFVVQKTAMAHLGPFTYRAASVFFSAPYSFCPWSSSASGA